MPLLLMVPFLLGNDGCDQQNPNETYAQQQRRITAQKQAQKEGRIEMPHLEAIGTYAPGDVIDTDSSSYWIGFTGVRREDQKQLAIISQVCGVFHTASSFSGGFKYELSAGGSLTIGTKCVTDASRAIHIEVLEIKDDDSAVIDAILR